MGVKRYTVEAGRQIYRDGKPFVSIHREGLGGPTEEDRGPSPTEADELTHVIAALLNRLGSRAIVTTYLKEGCVSRLVPVAKDSESCQ